MEIKITIDGVEFAPVAPAPVEAPVADTSSEAETAQVAPAADSSTPVEETASA